jgi:hypothetical protein
MTTHEAAEEATAATVALRRAVLLLTAASIALVVT